MTKRRGLFRTSIKRRGFSLFTIRDRKGRFANVESRSKSARRDRATKAKTTVRSGFGWRGDRPRR